MEFRVIKLADINIQDSENASRGDITPESCSELAHSIHSVGLLSPLAVTPQENGKYKLAYGFRRYTAVSMLGWEEVPALVIGDENSAKVQNLVENIQRQNLSFWEECQAIANVFPDTPQTDVSKALGKSRTWVRIRQKLWELSPDTIAQVERGLLGPADVSELITLSAEERIAAERLLQSKGEEKNREPVARKQVRTQKELRRMQTLIHELGREDWTMLILFALGETDYDTTREYLLHNQDNQRDVRGD